jgi:transposase
MPCSMCLAFTDAIELLFVLLTVQARQAAEDMRSEAAAARQRESAALQQLAQAQAAADQQQADMRYDMQ